MSPVGLGGLLDDKDIMDKETYKEITIPNCCGTCQHYKANNYVHQCWRQFMDEFKTVSIKINGICEKYENRRHS